MAERHHDLDWLRVLAVLTLIYFHTAVVFVPGAEFHIRNAQGSVPLEIFVLFMDQWYMPLFFLIAGASSWYALGSRTAGQYAGERFRRLFIPLVFGTLAIVPPQVYYQRLSEHAFHGSYLAFYPHFFQGVYPSGNFTWNQLWFIAYLFVYSMIALPVFVRLRGEGGRRCLSRIAAWVQEPGRIFLPALPLAVSEILLRARFPGPQNFVDDWADFSYQWIFFLYGYVIGSDARIRSAVGKAWRAALRLGCLTTLAGVAWLFLGRGPQPAETGPWVLLMLLRGVNSWCWILAILGAAQRFLNVNNRVLRYANQGAYPFYILHQTVIIFFAYYVVQWSTAIWAKYLVISTASMIAILVLYDLLVRRSPVTRFLFGMKKAAS